MLDAVSDKIFSLSLIIGILPAIPLFAINGALEGTIALINTKLLSKGGNPKSNLLGKIKIWPLSTALILGYLSLAIQDLNFMDITNESLLAISTVLSLGTIPLQVVNIKQYIDEYKKQVENKKEVHSAEEKELSKTDEKELSKTVEKTSKLKLSKENHQAMVYELPQNKKNELEKGKQHTKRLE